DLKGLFVDQTFNVEVLEEDVILLRINAGGPSLTDASGQLGWVSNSITGAFTGSDYSVSSGRASSGYVFDPANRHPSIPEYIDDNTYAQLFASERYNTEATMVYDIPLPDGEYL